MFSQGLSFGRIITQVDFQVDRRSRDVVRSTVMADNHVITRDVTPDPEIAAFVQQWKDRVAPVANKQIGKITADLNRVASPTGETPLGDVIADAQLETVKNEGAQLALMNPGGVRADLTYAASGAEGDGVVTYGEAFTVQPFNNLVGVVSLTGAQLDKLLEQQWQPQANGSVIERILQPSATLHYTMDKSQPIGQRISNITVNGAAVEDATSYKVAANSFLLGGGDGFTTFTEGTGQVLGPIDLDGFVAYMGAHSPVAPPALNRISAP
jgi:5'-nucleotidase